MENKCLYCYEPIRIGHNFHKKCSLEFFGTPTPPVIEYSLDQMDELAKNVVERSVAVPGVQAKLSMSLVKEAKGNSDARLTVIGALGGQYIFKPPSDRFPEMPENEHVSMRMAETFGIRVVPSSLSSLGEIMSLRPTLETSKAVPTLEGAGVKLHRAFGFQDPSELDPFLLFDDFRNEHPQDYIKGFPWHPHRGIETVHPFRQCINPIA